MPRVKGAKTPKKRIYKGFFFTPETINKLRELPDLIKANPRAYIQLIEILTAKGYNPLGYTPGNEIMVAIIDHIHSLGQSKAE